MAGEVEVTDWTKELSRADIDRITMMAWEDRTSFDAIRLQFGLSPGEIIKLMRQEMKASSFKMWRRRTQGRLTKHEARFSEIDSGNHLRRFRAKSQRG
ncbi:MAG: TIGR03643 family protein [Planctomycetota bacterium]